jgi:GAF domain-containing protein
MPDLPEEGLNSGCEALRRFLVGESDLPAMLTDIVELATKSVPGADVASITMITNDAPTTPVFTDDVALELDRVQYRVGDGPCLTSLRHQGVERVATECDHRWPAFSAAAVERGVKATLSAPLIDGEAAKGALNLYSRSSFGDDAAEIACLFADQLGVAALNAADYVQRAAMADQLLAAMESRAVIEQAKGILMRAEQCDTQQAFDILRRTSQGQNRKLREVARDLVRRYDDPRVAHPPE